MGQVVDVEGAESSPADPVEVALAIGLPTEIDAPLTEDSGEPLIDLVNLTLEEVMELKVIPKVYSSHGPSVDPTTLSLAQLMRTKVLSDVLSDTDDSVDLVAHKMADLLGIKVVMSGGSTSLDRQSFDDLIALSLSEIMGVRVASGPLPDPPPVIIALGGGANFTPFESISDLTTSTVGASTATSPLGDTSPSSFSSLPNSQTSPADSTGSNQGPVTPVNDAPAAAADSVTTSEDTALVISAASLLANDSDVDLDTLSIASFTQGANGTVVDNGDGTFTYAPNGDFNGVDSFTYTVSDGNGGTDTATVTVTVNAVNDAVGPVSDTNAAANSVSESAANGTVVGITALASDADGTDTVTYSLSDDAGGRFAIDAGGGVVTVADTSLLDYETATSHSVTVLATSSDGSTSSQAFTVNLTDANEAPTDLVFAANSGISLNADGGNNAYLYTANGGAIVGGLSQLTIELQFTLSNVIGDDIPLFSYHAGGASDEIELTLNGGSGSGPGFYIEIGEQAMQVAGYDATTLFDGGEHHVALTWNNSTGAWEIFVDSSSVASGSGIATGQTIAGGGTISLGQEQDSLGGGFNNTQVFEGTFYDVRIFNDVRTATEISDNVFTNVDSSEPGLIANWQMDDLSGGVTTETVAGEDLTVGNVSGAGWTDSTPSLVSTVPETAPNGRLVGTVAATDPDSGDTHTYALLDDAGGRFAIDANTGEITVANSALLDYEAQTSHNITVRVTDSGALTYDEVFTIDLSNVYDEAPVASASLASMEVDTAIKGTLTASDADVADTLTFEVNTGPSNGSVVINADGTYEYTPNASYTGADSFTFLVTDSGGQTSTATISIDVLTGSAHTMTGGAGNDSFIGGDQIDTLTGGAGDDRLEGGAGSDNIDGGSGADTASYEGSGSAVTIDLDAGTASGGDAAGDTLTSIENLIGSSNNDTLTGDGSSNVIDGGAGSDSVYGLGGDDIIIWDAADATIDGGSGTDSLRVDSGDVDLTTFAGTIQGIENIDLEADAGANSLTLTVQDVLDISDTDTLTIVGTSVDSVNAGTSWTDGGFDGGGNHIYTQMVGESLATLVVDPDVAVNPDILM